MTLEAAALLLGWGGSPTHPYPEPHILWDLINETGRPQKAFILAAGKPTLTFFSDLT